MAASRSMLESLLARVRQRAAEPRSGAMPAIPPLPVPRVDVPASSAPAASAVSAKQGPTATLSSSPVLETAAALEEEEVEEYDEELIEILDDGDVASESGEVAAESGEDSSPIELRAAEMRRRSAPTTRPPAPRTSAIPAAPTAVAVAVPAAMAPSAAMPAPALRADVVERRPVPAGAVVQSPALRPDARTASFIELLEASLKLGA